MYLSSFSCAKAKALSICRTLFDPAERASGATERKGGERESERQLWEEAVICRGGQAELLSGGGRGEQVEIEVRVEVKAGAESIQLCQV